MQPNLRKGEREMCRHRARGVMRALAVVLAWASPASGQYGPRTVSGAVVSAGNRVPSPLTAHLRFQVRDAPRTNSVKGSRRTAQRLIRAEPPGKNRHSLASHGELLSPQRLAPAAITALRAAAFPAVRPPFAPPKLKIR